VKDWKLERSHIEKEAGDWRNRMNTEMVHLTTLRKAGQVPEKQWSLSAIVSDLSRTYDVFRRHSGKWSEKLPENIPCLKAPTDSDTLTFTSSYTASSTGWIVDHLPVLPPDSEEDTDI
jgi:hypothetical protein